MFSSLWTIRAANQAPTLGSGRWPSYGRNVEGLVALQDHGDEVWYRNVRIRRL